MASGLDLKLETLDRISKRATELSKTIVLYEAPDERIVNAAIEATKQKLATIFLVVSQEQVEQTKNLLGSKWQDQITIICPQTSPLTEELVALRRSLQGKKPTSDEAIIEEVMKPSVFAALMVKAGKADGCVGGAVHSSAEVIRTAIKTIGPNPDSPLISSFFLMAFDRDYHTKKGVYVFSDAGMVIDPNEEELSEIAIASSRSFQQLTGQTPRVAMLSFSTHGSANHQRVTKVREATELVKKKAPDLLIDGELQFDAAFVPEVSASKAPSSPLKGNANVFIFPNLDAGNIGYKIAERMAGARAIGPILQGLSAPANDLSRGCSTNDVVQMIAVTCVQAAQ